MIVVTVRLMFWGTYWAIKLTIYGCLLMFHLTVWAIKGAVALTALIIAGVGMIIAAHRAHKARADALTSSRHPAPRQSYPQSR